MCLLCLPRLQRLRKEPLDSRAESAWTAQAQETEAQASTKGVATQSLSPQNTPQPFKPNPQRTLQRPKLA